MKNILDKKIKIVLGMLLSAMLFVSCLTEEEISITEPNRYTAGDIKSYADIFKVFWTVMDQQYNYFLEEYRKDGRDWDMIYQEYYPKFASLKTFGQGPGVTNGDIQRDTDLARQYFREIVEPLIDRHFYVTVRLPSGNSSLSPHTFLGDQSNKTIYNLFTQRYMPNRVMGDTIWAKNTLVAGSLRSHPDTYYFGLKSFDLFSRFNMELNESYLIPYSGNKYILKPGEIDTNTNLLAIKDLDLRNRTRDFSRDVLNRWNEFFNSGDVKKFNNNVAKFRATEIVSGEFMNVAGILLDSSMQLSAYSSPEAYSSITTDESSAYITWFVERINEHLEKGYELSDFLKAASDVVNKGSFYKKFLNPLTRGDIKKLIIDLRGNGGGSASDLQFLASRLVTKTTIYGYQRVKEGNGRFNYTPWAPIYTNPHPFGVPSKIPVAILTDFGSASTSEISTLLLRSQGEHIISVGDYTRGATAGLTADSDDFNANSVDVVAGGYLKFYMPVMAFKDEKGKIIEGIGIEPNILVDRISPNDVTNIFYSPDTYIDKVLNRALEHLK